MTRSRLSGVLSRLWPLSLAAAALGCAGLAIGFVLEPRQALFSYLVAFAFVMSIAFGGLVFLMMGHVTRASWVVVLRRPTEAIAAALPFCLILFIPIALGQELLYSWSRPGAQLSAETSELIHHKRAYLNVPFFLLRAGLYFAVWTACTELLLIWSRRQDLADAVSAGVLSARQRALSAAALPVLALTVTFAAVDWFMSLDPAWVSTVYGLLIFAGGFVASLALLAALTHAARAVPVLATSIRPAHVHALGKLVLAFVIFWVYLQYAQGFIIWIANRPSEASWYVARTHGSWAGLLLFLILGHFVLPFFILLSRALKRRSGVMALVGLWLVAMHYVDVYWLIMPVLHVQGLAPHWLDLSALLALLGLTTAFSALRLDRADALPVGDPGLRAGLEYHGS